MTNNTKQYNNENNTTMEKKGNSLFLGKFSLLGIAKK
jgi:hypothetical protein